MTDKFVACIERDSGFSTYRDQLVADSLPNLLKAIRKYADEAMEYDFLCILGSTNDPESWEAIEDCWETYVVPAIEKRELVKSIKHVEDEIAKLEFWFSDLENTKVYKHKTLELHKATLKTLKEQQ